MYYVSELTVSLLQGFARINAIFHKNTSLAYASTIVEVQRIMTHAWKLSIFKDLIPLGKSRDAPNFITKTVDI